MTSTIRPAMDPAAMRVCYSSNADMKFNPGRRAWISYRDLGVEAATLGAMRAEVMHIDEAGTAEPTPWHYHTLDVQFLMVIQGWVTIEFADRTVTVNEGESIVIPGGTVHRELGSSEPMRLLEVTLPGAMETVPADAPEQQTSQTRTREFRT